MRTRDHHPGAARLLLCSVMLAIASAPAADGRTFRLRRLVVVGDSVLAGFGSGGFVASGHPGEGDSAPAFVARRARGKLPPPLIDPPGVPPPLAVVHRNPNGPLAAREGRRTPRG